MLLTISNQELSHIGKVAQIREFLKRCSGKKTTYSFTVIGNTLSVLPGFKSQEALERVKAGIDDILSDMCEELDGRGNGCSEHYACCGCGGNNCGCRGCFSCNACSFCTEE